MDFFRIALTSWARGGCPALPKATDSSAWLTAQTVALLNSSNRNLSAIHKPENPLRDQSARIGPDLLHGSNARFSYFSGAFSVSGNSIGPQKGRPDRGGDEVLADCTAGIIQRRSGSHSEKMEPSWSCASKKSSADHIF